MIKSQETFWSECVEVFKQKVPSEYYRTWFEPLKFVAIVDNELTLGVPSKFFLDHFDDHYASYLLNVVRWVLNTKYGISADNLKLQYNVHEEESKNEEQVHAADEKKKSTFNAVQRSNELPDFDSQLNQNYTMESFVEGNSNKLAHSIGLSIIDNPGKNTFNPLFLYGASGVGKTHLVNAVGLKIQRRYPKKRVLFVSAHVFKTQYTDSVIHNTSNEFINFYQTIDVLIIDDIQEITTVKTLQAFFHIFNHLQQNNRQIIITCDRPPVSLEGMEERMLTRFKWGMTVEMERPDMQLRRAILITKIRRDGLTIPQDVIEYIVDHVDSSVREIEGVINSLMAYSVVDNCDINLELASRVVGRAVNLERRELSAEDIVAVVCKFYGLKRRELSKTSRKANLVRPRQVAMYLIQKYTEMSTVDIGRLFGNRDHSTVVYACTKIIKWISSKSDFRREVEDIEAKLK